MQVPMKVAGFCRSEWQTIAASILVCFTLGISVYHNNNNNLFSGPRTVPQTLKLRETNPMKIPKILHQCVMEPPKSQQNDAKRISPLWMESCRQHYVNAGWKHMIWKDENSLEYINKTVPWFYETYKNYPSLTHRCDALRYVLMYHLGGMYLDADIECWREGSDMLEGYDVVLQGSQGKNEPVTNAAIASAPGHPLWRKAFELLLDRKNRTKLTVGDITYSTGPDVVKTAVQMLGLYTPKDSRGQWQRFPPEYRYKNTVIKTWPMGQWYHPCRYNNSTCNRETDLNRAFGLQNMTYAVGIHRYTVTWVRNRHKSYGISSTEQAKAAICD